MMAQGPAALPKDGMEVDVLVAGGGPAGLGAALGAARQGVRTLLVERMGFLGGVASIGLGMTINQMRPGGLPRSVVHEALIAQLLRYGDAALRIEDHALITNTEYLKLAAFEALEQAGCEYLVHAFVSGAYVHHDHVTGVTLSTKSGPVHVRAKRVVDATGDGDVCYFAGCPMEKGREGDGFLSPMTSLFVIGGVDVDAARAYQKGDRGWQCLLAEGHCAGYVVPDRMGVTPTVYPDSVFVNHSGTKRFGPLDGTDPRDQTKAERLMRQQAVDVVRLLRDRHVPGFEQAYLQQVSPWAGVRETRRIVGEYVLTEDDAMTGARFFDAIARRYGFLDIGFVRYEPMTPHDVPYRALLPLRVENILAAGRIISTTHVAMSAGKSMGNCMATGHAAGVAAALSIGAGVTPRALPAARLRAGLRDEGVALDG